MVSREWYFGVRTGVAWVENSNAHKFQNSNLATGARLKIASLGNWKWDGWGYLGFNCWSIQPLSSIESWQKTDLPMTYLNEFAKKKQIESANQKLSRQPSPRCTAFVPHLLLSPTFVQRGPCQPMKLQHCEGHELDTQMLDNITWIFDMHIFICVCLCVSVCVRRVPRRLCFSLS